MVLLEQSLGELVALFIAISIIAAAVIFEVWKIKK